MGDPRGTPLELRQIGGLHPSIGEIHGGEGGQIGIEIALAPDVDQIERPARHGKEDRVARMAGDGVGDERQRLIARRAQHRSDDVQAMAPAGVTNPGHWPMRRRAPRGIASGDGLRISQGIHVSSDATSTESMPSFSDRRSCPSSGGNNMSHSAVPVEMRCFSRLDGSAAARADSARLEAAATDAWMFSGRAS